MNKITTLYVWKAQRDGESSLNEEESASMRAYNAFRVRHKAAMDARDGISPMPAPPPSQATLRDSPHLRTLWLVQKSKHPEE